MNKKFTVIIIIIILFIVGYFIWGVKSSNVSNINNPQTVEQPKIQTVTTPTTNVGASITKDTTDSALISRLKTVSVDAAETGSRVALVNGKAQFSTDGTKGTITLGNVAIEKNIGGTNYVVATMAVNSGNPTPSVYTVLFKDVSGSPLDDLSYSLVGSGVQIDSMRADQIADGFVVTVVYTNPTSAPGKSQTKILFVENGEFNPSKEINL